MPSSADLVASQDEYQRHVWPVCLWPDQWKTCNLRLIWRSVALNRHRRSDVPTATGVYSLMVQPGIAGHSTCSYLMYIGKAKNLRKRFGDYLTRERIRRPKVVRLLGMYSGHISFFYCTIDEDLLDDTEDELLNAFVPPCNSQFTGEVQQARGAF